MEIEEQILINKFGQNLVEISLIEEKFKSLGLSEKRNFLNDMIFFIMQSKPKEDDITEAISQSKLKKTFTPCILLAKGVENHNLLRIVNLPENELEKSLLLFLSLFKVAYKRKFELERNNTSKWWYWDLSNDSMIEKILNLQ
jgi:hypothetical protein